jgi:hypothetical protein
MRSLLSAGLCQVPDKKHSAKLLALGKGPDSGSDVYLNMCAIRSSGRLHWWAWMLTRLALISCCLKENTLCSALCTP